MHLLCRSCISHPVVFCKIDSFIEWTLQKACTEQNKPFRWPPESAEKYRKHGLKSCFLPFSRMGARPGTGSALPAASRVEFGHSSMQGTPLLFTHDLTGNERKSSNTRSLLLDRVSDRVTPFLSVELQTPQGQAESLLQWSRLQSRFFSVSTAP